MKKKWLILTAAIALLGPAKAQQTKGLEIGFQGGPGAVFFYQPRFADVTLPLTGGLAGLSLQYNLPRFVSLRAEVDYERKGALSALTFQNQQNQYSANVVYDRIHYITVPVMARLSFGRRVQFFTDLGLYAGFRVKAIESVSNTYIGTGDGFMTAREKNNITNQVANVDGGAVVGLGLTVHMKKIASFMIEARNNFGFADVHSKSAATLARQMNNATYLLMGFGFKLNRQ